MEEQKKLITIGTCQELPTEKLYCINTNNFNKVTYISGSDMTPLEIDLKKFELLQEWYKLSKKYKEIHNEIAWIEMMIDQIDDEINKKPTAE